MEASTARVLRFMSAVMLVAGFANVTEAATPYPLDRPVDEIKTVIANIAGCKWIEPQKLSADLMLHYCDGPDSTERGAWIQMTITANGNIDLIHLSPAVDQTTFHRVTKETKAQERIMANLMAALFPSWDKSRAWIRNAMRNSRTEHFHTSIRVSETSIYVLQASPVDRDDNYAVITLTRKTDLTEFKARPCDDNEQGPGLDSCTERDGPRPPDNPILHPK